MIRNNPSPNRLRQGYDGQGLRPTSKKASVLLFTLLILSVIAILTQQLVRNVWVGTFFNNEMIAREQAKVLALSGVNLAISQLTLKLDDKKKDKAKTEDQKKESQTKDFLTRVFPALNRWQSFDLEEKFDEINGQIKICITCENGKININDAFDFQKNEFKKESKLLLAGLNIKGILKEGEILKRLTTFFKERKKKLDDITELVNVPGLEHIDVFYNPPQMPKGKKYAQSNGNIYLQDLFTVWSSSDKIELLFASDSLCSVLGIRRPLADDQIKLEAKYKTFIEAFKKDLGADWDKNWLCVQPFFGPKPKRINEFNQFLSKEFGPQVYSVLSCGEVKGVKQKLLAVIKQVEEPQKKADKKASESNEKEKKTENSQKNFKIIRMYWL